MRGWPGAAACRLPIVQSPDNRGAAPSRKPAYVNARNRPIPSACAACKLVPCGACGSQYRAPAMHCTALCSAHTPVVTSLCRCRFSKATTCVKLWRAVRIAALRSASPPSASASPAALTACQERDGGIDVLHVANDSPAILIRNAAPQQSLLTLRHAVEGASGVFKIGPTWAAAEAFSCGRTYCSSVCSSTAANIAAT